MKTITAIHFKHPGVSGLRCFQTTEAAIQGGEIPASLHAVGGVLVKWPVALGAPPDDATVTTWEAEYDAHVVLEGKRVAAEKALQEAAFNAALNDPSAPQAVKDYKAAKDK